MSKKINVLIVGWHPSAVDYNKWPGLTAEKLQAAIDSDLIKLNDLGYEAELGLIESERTAEQALLARLLEKQRDCVLIGAGVRTDPEHLHLFERLLNTIHQHAPSVKICFNSGPFDSVAAVERWVSIPQH